MSRVMPSAFNVEFQLLLACSGIHVDRDLIQSLVIQTKNWKRVVGYAERHGLILQLCQRLEEANCDIPIAFSERVKRDVRQLTYKNLLLTAELVRTMQAFASERIRAIPYKGAVLAATTFGNLAMRDFCDLDILVSEQDVRRVLRMMPQLGYRAEFSFTAAQERKYLRSACEYNFVHEQTQVPVEIHWQVIPPKFGLKFDFDRFWSRAGSVHVGDQRLPTLSPEDALLVLAVHGFKHLWDCLKWVCDVANTLCAQEKLDWTYIERQADRMGAMRLVLIAMSLANQVCESPLPDPIELGLRRDRAAVSIAKEIVARYLADRSMSRLQSRFLMVRACSGLRRLSYIARSLFDPTTEELVLAPERSLIVMRAQHLFHVAYQFVSCSSQSPTN